MKKNELRIKEKIVSACNIPPDIGLGYPIVSLIGNCAVIIENYRGIIEYDKETIRVQTKLGQIKVTGKALNIAYYTNEEMKIEGIIKCFEYI